MYIYAKSWGKGDDGKECYTGNFKITCDLFEPLTDYRTSEEIFQKEFEIVSICQIKSVLEYMRSDKNIDYDATDEEIEKEWNKRIIEYNKNRDLYKDKFSLVHKDYYSNLTSGYGQFYFTESMIKRQTEKAFYVAHPIIGCYWIPKAMCIDYSLPENMTDGYRKYILQGNVTEKEYYVRSFFLNNLKDL